MASLAGCGTGREGVWPLVTRAIPGVGMAVAGARRRAVAPGETPLLRLHVRLHHGALPGIYPTGLAPTIVQRREAGYPPFGVPLPVLLGRDVATNTWPVLLNGAGGAANLLAGSVQFLTLPADADADSAMLRASYAPYARGIVGSDAAFAPPSQAPPPPDSPPPASGSMPATFSITDVASCL